MRPLVPERVFISSPNWKLAISFSGILCPTDFLMIEIIYNHRMSLRDSAIRHFIIHKGTIILLSHFLSFYFKCFKVAAVMLVIDLIVKRYKSIFPHIIRPGGFYIGRKLSKRKPRSQRNEVFGGDKRDRTADLLNAIQALSQLSYTPRCLRPSCDCLIIIARNTWCVNRKIQKIR